MKMANSKEQQERLARLAAKPEDEIDTADIPEVLDWSDAVRGGLYRPKKEAITIRLDADLLAWFRSHRPDGRGYQSEINRVLRRHVASAKALVERESGRRLAFLGGSMPEIEPVERRRPGDK